MSGRTVRDLVEALEVDQERPFDAEEVWRRSQVRARQLRARRLAVAVGAAAAVATAIVAPSMVLLAGSPGSVPYLPAESGAPTATTSAFPTPTLTTTLPSTPVSTRPALSETLRAVSEGGWLILPTETSAYHQRANVLRDSALVASVDIYESGVFDPSPLLDGVRTTVDGAPAYFAWVPDPFSMNGDPLRTLAWERTPDGWVVARMEPDGSPPSRSSQIPPELQEIASLVEIGEPLPIRLPFRVSYRPDGVVPHSVTHFAASYPDRTVYYEYADEPVDFRDPQRDLKFPLSITMRPAQPGQWQPNTTMNGLPAMRIGITVTVAINDDVWITVSGGAVSPLSAGEIDQVFAGLTFADWNDESTWFDANVAA